MQISSSQWQALASNHQAGFRKRLVQFIAERFKADPAAPHFKSPEKVADAALHFADIAGDMTELQIARIALILVAVNRMQVQPEGVEQVRALLSAPNKTNDERLESAAAYLGILR